MLVREASKDIKVGIEVTTKQSKTVIDRDISGEGKFSFYTDGEDPYTICFSFNRKANPAMTWPSLRVKTTINLVNDAERKEYLQKQKIKTKMDVLIRYPESMRTQVHRIN